jgi:predicted outer membrane repeat protein
MSLTYSTFIQNRAITGGAVKGASLACG